jgi:hypothetical protein
MHPAFGPNIKSLWLKDRQQARTENEAFRSYERARSKASLHRLLGQLRREPVELLELDRIKSDCMIAGQHYSGVQQVSIQQILGSEGRSKDFDRDFHPVTRHTADRWRQVYKARWEGLELPPVVLIQIGDTYYVRDGHHRVSVARELGQELIDAEVTVMEFKTCAI